MADNSPSLRAQPEDRGLQSFLTSYFNASALYDSHNASNIPRPFVQENITHTALGLNVLGRIYLIYNIITPK